MESLFLPCSLWILFIDLLYTNVAFLYHLKISEKAPVFQYFQGVEKWKIDVKLVKKEKNWCEIGKTGKKLF